MKAVVVEKPGKVVVKSVADPRINEHEVLVRVISSSICNLTDWHIVHGTFDGYHDFYPQILGHEVYGEVIEAGSSVDMLKVGDRIVEYADQGTFCERVKFTPHQWLSCWAKVPERLTSLNTSFCEMCHGAYIGSVYPMQIKEHESVLVVGQGPMGLMVSQGAKLHARKVLSVDLYQNRLDKAKELGVDKVYNRSKLSSARIVKRIMEETEGAGVDAAVMAIDIDLTEERDGFDMAVSALKPGGRLRGLHTGVKGINNPVNAAALIVKHIRFMQHEPGATKSPHEVFQFIVDQVADGNIKIDPLLTHVVGLDGVAEAVEMCKLRPQECIKVRVMAE